MAGIASRALAAALLLAAAGAAAAAELEAGLTPLAPPRLDGPVAVEEALARRRSVREYTEEGLSLAEVGQLLWAAQGVSGEKGRRTAPSAGALYPLETYLVAGAVTGLAPGVYRYEPRHHRLRLHRPGDVRAALADSALEQEWVAEAPALLLLGAVYARTASKYGARAPRYVHIEVGHAAQNVYLQAVGLGLGTVVVGAFHDARLAEVVALPPDVEPVAILPVGRPR
jgi:SagB-type dehydrogenase family enzyme